MKSVFFIIYLVIFTFLLLGGFILSLDNLSLTSLINTLISLSCIVGGFAYIRKFAISTPNFWLGLFYLAIASLVLTCIFQLLEGNFFIVLFVVTIQIPILIALKRYSNSEAIQWFSDEEKANADSLQSMLLQSSMLELSSEKQSVRVMQENDVFSTTINRLGENGNEEFTQSFTNLSALVKFIELHTKFRFEDFANKYA